MRLNRSLVAVKHLTDPSKIIGQTNPKIYPNVSILKPIRRIL